MDLAAGDPMMIHVPVSLTIIGSKDPDDPRSPRAVMRRKTSRALAERAIRELRARAVCYSNQIFCLVEIELCEDDVVLSRLIYYRVDVDRRINLFKNIYRFTVNGWVKIEYWEWSSVANKFIPVHTVEHFEEPKPGIWVDLTVPHPQYLTRG